MQWNYVDLSLLLVVVSRLVQGWRRGLWYGLIDLLAWISSALLALRLYQPMAIWIGPYGGWPPAWDQPVAFVLTLTIGGMLISLLGHALIKRLPKDTHRRFSNRLFGILPGFANGLLSAAILAALLFALPLPHALRAHVQASILANRLAANTQRFEAALTPIFGDALTQTLTQLTVQPESDELVTLPYAVADPAPMPELEAQMLVLINQERAKAGLAPLVADPALAEVARRHAVDMFARSYFAHDTPEGISPFDRMNAAGISYRTAGENLALAPTLVLAHSGLMNSPGHRANILRPEFGRVGIGIVDGGMRGLMITQNFRD